MSVDVYIRAFSLGDVLGLVEIANNRNISDNLSDGFSNPFTEEAAIKFINETLSSEVISRFAIIYEGKHVGNIGLHPQTDIYARNAEVGYFIGEAYWGKGIATKAIELIVQHGFEKLDLVRIFAGVFSYNKGSMRALEKCGFEFEGISRHGAVKNNKILDVHEFAVLNPRY